ncbi:MAG: hypothetical protein HY775_03080 [Acidobacteria bacterium]|nr:hypothetical protein [Acidobacteriota bacterium]
MPGEAGLPFERLVVRPALRAEPARFDELVDSHHYLGSCRPIGRSMCYVAECGDEQGHQVHRLSAALHGDGVVLTGSSAPT